MWSDTEEKEEEEEEEWMGLFKNPSQKNKKAFIGNKNVCCHFVHGYFLFRLQRSLCFIH